MENYYCVTHISCIVCEREKDDVSVDKFFTAPRRGVSVYALRTGSNGGFRKGEKRKHIHIGTSVRKYAVLELRGPG